MKKPFVYALVAIVYIVLLVLSMNTFSSFLPENKIIIPMVMLSLFVLSAAIMGFLFLYEPLTLLMENRQQEALIFFAKILGIFACLVALFLVALFVL